MVPRPQRIIVCPSCKALERYMPVTSYVTGVWILRYGWTDGFSIDHWIPWPPQVVKCGECSHVYWLEDAEVIGEIRPWGKEPPPSEWHKVRHVVEPSEADYYAALSSGLARTPEEEHSARVLAWWKSNEPLRAEIVARVHASWNEHFGRNSESPSERRENEKWNIVPAARQTNMELLLPLLDMSNAGDRLMKAEVLRQLGRFDEALTALRNVESDAFSWIVDQIRPLCDGGDTLVRLLDRPARPDPVQALDHGPLPTPEESASSLLQGLRQWQDNVGGGD